MIELYIFIVAIVAIILIITHRDVIYRQDQKKEFKKKVSSQIEAYKKQEQEGASTRFRDQIQEERKSKKADSKWWSTFVFRISWVTDKAQREGGRTFEREEREIVPTEENSRAIVEAHR